MIRDSYYTPTILAEKLVNWINVDKIDSAADFCIGDGELLRAASNRWPNAQYYGSDISIEAIENTQSKHPNWQLSTLDFLNEELRIKSNITGLNMLFDLILLNPPFSCIGASSNKVIVNGEVCQVSTAMKFIVEAINYLKSDGILYAILPASVAYSNKDKKIWNILVDRYNLCILEESNIRYFQGCVPNIILVSLNDFTKTSKYKPFEKGTLFIKDLEVLRGKISMYKIPLTEKKFYFIHTTNLKNNRLENLVTKVDYNPSTVTGPALLIPRVGKPNASKLCLINSDETYVLSDCIIAIKVTTLMNAMILFNYFLENWDTIEKLYNGTGAKYITVERIKNYLNIDFNEIVLQNNNLIEVE